MKWWLVRTASTDLGGGVERMSLFDSVINLVGANENFEQLTKRLDIDNSTGEASICAAVPALLDALAARAEESGGPDLMTQLVDEIDVSFLGHIGSFLGGGEFSLGQDLLKIAFGQRWKRMVELVAERSDVDDDVMADVVPLVFPVIIAIMKRRQAGVGLGAEGLRTLMLGERVDLQRRGLDAYFGVYAQTKDAIRIDVSEPVAAPVSSAPDGKGTVVSRARMVATSKAAVVVGHKPHQVSESFGWYGALLVTLFLLFAVAILSFQFVR